MFTVSPYETLWGKRWSFSCSLLYLQPSAWDLAHSRAQWLLVRDDSALWWQGQSIPLWGKLAMCTFVGHPFKQDWHIKTQEKKFYETDTSEPWEKTQGVTEIFIKAQKFHWEEEGGSGLMEQNWDHSGNAYSSKWENSRNKEEGQSFCSHGTCILSVVNKQLPSWIQSDNYESWEDNIVGSNNRVGTF